MSTISSISGGMTGYPGRPPLEPVAKPADQTESSGESSGKPKALNGEQVDKIAQDIQARFLDLGLDHKVSIRKDANSGASIIEVRDEKGKLLNQFPPEKLLNLRRFLADLSGVVINRMT